MNVDQWTTDIIKRYGKDAIVEEIFGWYDEAVANITCIIKKESKGTQNGHK